MNKETINKLKPGDMYKHISYYFNNEIEYYVIDSYIMKTDDKENYEIYGFVVHKISDPNHKIETKVKTISGKYYVYVNKDEISSTGNIIILKDNIYGAGIIVGNSIMFNNRFFPVSNLNLNKKYMISENNRIIEISEIYSTELHNKYMKPIDYYDIEQVRKNCIPIYKRYEKYTEDNMEVMHE